MESNRRANEEVTYNQRFNEIHQEIEHTQTKHKAIDLWWTSLQAKEDCEELHHAIEEAKQECQEIIDRKDSLVASFKEQLEQKDEEYKNSLKR